MRFVAIIYLTLVLCSGCERPKRPPASLAEVKAMLCGSYKGEYNHGVEYIEIKPEGTFSQKFIQRGVTVYNVEGKWTFHKLQDHYLVSFEPFMDLEMAILKGESPKRSTGREAAFYEDESKLWFFRDISYYVTRQSEKTGAKPLGK